METKGSILVLGLVVTSVLLLFGGIFLDLTLMNIETITTDSDVLIADYIAYAGLMRLIHDMRENFSDYQQNLFKVKFSDGYFQIGTATIAERGIRNILVISKGTVERGKDTKISSALVCLIDVNVPTDYAMFSDGDESIRMEYPVPAFFYYGPIYVNGKLYLKAKFTPTKAQDQVNFVPQYIVILKPDDIRGPAINVTEKVIYEGVAGGTGQTPNFPVGTAKVVAGFGEAIASDAFMMRYTDIRWSGESLVFGESTGAVTTNQPNPGNGYLTVRNIYPVNYTLEPTSDLTGNGILYDKYHNAIKIRTISYDEINLSNFQDDIDPDWLIKDYNFKNTIFTQRDILNDTLAKKDIIARGKWDGISSINDSELYTFSYTPLNRIIKHLYYIKERSGMPMYSDGTPVIFPKREIDPRTNEYTTDYLISPGTSDDTFTAENGVLTIPDANSWKKHWLAWYVPSNVYYGPTADAASTWISEAENRLYLDGRDITYQTNGPMSMDRELKAVRFGDNYILDSSEYSEPPVVENPNAIDDDISKRKIVLANPKTFTYSGLIGINISGEFLNKVDGVNDEFYFIDPVTIKEYKYYWVSKVEVDSGSGFVTKSGRPYYAGWNYYYQSAPLNDYRRWWNSSNNRFGLKFTSAPAIGTQIKITLGKWWFPKASSYTTDCDAVFFQQYPPRTDTIILTDPMIKTIELNLTKIDEMNFPKNSNYPLGFVDYNGNGIKDTDEPYRPGIIYSKVPLIIKGSPKVPITIICEDDVYLGSINKDKPDDDSNAYPVAIMCKKVVWSIHGYENTYEAREIVLNKVAIFTRSEKIYDLGGQGNNWGQIPGQIGNKTKLIGTFAKMKINKYGILDTNDKPDKVAIEFGSTYTVSNKSDMLVSPQVYIFDINKYLNIDIPNQMRYAKSFRKNVAPYIPVDMKIRGIKSVDYKNADKFFSSLYSYILSKSELKSEVYMSLLQELEK